MEVDAHNVAEGAGTQAGLRREPADHAHGDDQRDEERRAAFAVGS